MTAEAGNGAEYKEVHVDGENETSGFVVTISLEYPRYGLSSILNNNWMSIKRFVSSTTSSSDFSLKFLSSYAFFSIFLFFIFVIWFI